MGTRDDGWEEIDEYKGCKIMVAQDTEPFDPREDDDNCMAHMWCWHGRYNIGDDHKKHCIPESFDESAEDYINESYDVVWMSRIRMYEHGQIGIRLEESASGYPWNCPFDSGWLGLYFITSDVVKARFGCKRISKKTLARAIECAKAEFNEYAAYIEGDCVGYRVLVDDGSEDDGEEIDSCWGYFDYWGKGKTYLLESAHDAIDSYRKTHLEQPLLPGMEEEA
jgi:hypothetical protein